MKDAGRRIIEPGNRVALCPHTDLFMQGLRFGVVVRLGRKYVQVSLDRNNQIVRVRPGDIVQFDVEPPAVWLIKDK